MSLNAYHQRQMAAESPKETEYRLFGRVTGALIEAGEKKTDRRRIDEGARLEPASMVHFGP